MQFRRGGSTGLSGTLCRRTVIDRVHPQIENALFWKAKGM
jgi:hypothetical protein